VRGCTGSSRPEGGPRGGARAGHDGGPPSGWTGALRSAHGPRTDQDAGGTSVLVVVLVVLLTVPYTGSTGWTVVGLEAMTGVG